MEVRTGLDEGFGQVLPCFCVGSISDITFPESKYFIDEVVFEEFHRGKHVEHCTLLHPVGKRQKLSGCCVLFYFCYPASLFVLNLNHTLCTNCKVFFFKFLFIFNYNKIVRAVTCRGYRFAITIQKFNWHICPVFCKKANRLVSSFDGLNHVPAGCIFSDKIRLPKLSCLVVCLPFRVDNLFKASIMKCI